MHYKSSFLLCFHFLTACSCIAEMASLVTSCTSCVFIVSEQEQAVDAKTRLIMYKLVNSGILEAVNGIISCGKESVIFHADGGRWKWVMLLTVFHAVVLFITTLSHWCSYHGITLLSVRKTSVSQLNKHLQFLLGMGQIYKIVGQT